MNTTYLGNAIQGISARNAQLAAADAALSPPPITPQGTDDVIPASPLVLDLDGDGVETLSKEDGIQFDLDNNGFAETVGWVSADDGLLAIDLNGDGAISGGNELFGNQTILNSGVTAINGFVALADYDENTDGFIDANDSVFTQLKVWQDVNSDGVSGPEELLSLDSLGISSLSLLYENSSTSVTVDENGNAHSQIGSYQTTDGEIHAMTDVWFAVDPTRTTALMVIDTSEEIEALPDAQGFGNVYSLHQAMAQDESGALQSLVQQFVDATDSTTRNELLEQIMYQWVGGYNAEIPAGYCINDFITLEQYTVLVSFLGVEKPFYGPEGAVLLSERYEQLTDIVFYQLSAQTFLKDYYKLIDFTYDVDRGVWLGDYSLVAAVIASQAISDEVAAEDLLHSFMRSVRGVNPYIEDNDEAFKGELIEIVKDTGGVAGIANLVTSLSCFYFDATDGNDTLNGGAGIESINGLGGDDLLYGGLGDDFLKGGTGNDILYGGGGDDIFIFNLGDGQDVVMSDDAEGFESLFLGTDIAFSDMTLEKVNNDLVVKVGENGDQVTMNSWFLAHNIDNFVLSDGTAVIGVELLEQKPVYSFGTELGNSLYGCEGLDIQYGAAGSDRLYGYAGNDELYGEAGTDTLQGGDGDDELHGGADSDTLYGGSGNDRFIFNLGDGQDVIIADDAAGIDSLVFGAGITYDDVTLEKVNYDLVVKVGQSGDQVTLVNWFYAAYVDKRMDQFIFSDGTIISGAELLAQKAVYSFGTEYNETLVGHEGMDIQYGGLGNDYLCGYAGNDVLYGESGADNLQGGDGDDELHGGADNDTLYGGSGDDDYLFAVGDGVDAITDESGSDSILFGENISTEDVVLLKSGNDLLIGYSSEDQITLKNYTGLEQGADIETVSLTDGSYLSDSDINQLIQDMSAYAVNEGISLTSLNDVRAQAELMTMIAERWQAA